MNFDIKKKWVTVPAKHNAQTARRHYVLSTKKHILSMEVNGTSNWDLLTAPPPKGLGLNVDYDTAITDVFTTAPSLQQFADSIQRIYGVAMTPTQITAQGTFGQLINYINAKQMES